MPNRPWPRNLVKWIAASWRARSTARTSHALAIDCPRIEPLEPRTLLSAAAPFDPAEAFSLSSNAGANHVIYLDFTGHTTVETIWNTPARDKIETLAFDEDGDPFSFNETERRMIHEIWQRVAEDFIPFDVNITTQDPGVANLMKTGSGDTKWGVRVVIGGNGAWHSRGGGIAFVSTFDSRDDTPAFVFSENLGSSAKTIGEAVSHEAGHTLGLNHDGQGNNNYFTGFGSGATGWSPIMGESYDRELTQWSSGQYGGASNLQDDLAIITGDNGFDYRKDDHGDSFSGASPLRLADEIALIESGIIEQNTDVDVFRLTLGDGYLHLNIDPAAIGANLDVLASLYDSEGTIIAVSNPRDAIHASFDIALEAGTYYLSVDGIGRGDPSSGGYSDYASLGQYSISGAFHESIDIVDGAGQSLNGSDYDNNLGFIAGVAFHDRNDDGARELSSGEKALAGAVVYIDANNNGRFDAGERRSQTNELGGYFIGSLARGRSYAIRVDPGDGADVGTFDVQAGTAELGQGAVVIDHDFAFSPRSLDRFGDERTSATDLGLLDGSMSVSDHLGWMSSHLDAEDYLQFTVKGRRVQFDAALAGGPTHVMFQLVNRRGKVIASSERINSRPTMTRNLRKGRYFLRVFIADADGHASPSTQNTSSPYEITLQSTQIERKKRRRRRRG